MILVLNPEEHETLLAILAHNPDAKRLKRVQIVLGLASGVGPTELSWRVGCDRSTVYRVGRRFAESGLDALEDGRTRLRGPKTSPAFLTALTSLVDTSPRDHGWERSTWSLELLSLTLVQQGRTRVHPATIATYLASAHIAFNRAKPVLVSPDPDKEAKLAAIEKLKAELPADERLFYADEVDIHLNPKIGPQWSKRGQQPRVVTPGNNRKSYIAGAQDHQSGQLVYLEGARKNSDLFIGLLEGLVHFYPDTRVIHVVADNYIIHKSKKTLAALARLGDRVKLHFLPSYSPDHNPIERLWKELHACVTRNHDAKDIEELMTRVDNFLEKGRDNPTGRRSLAKAS